jgi:hypothetical protein
MVEPEIQAAAQVLAAAVVARLRSVVRQEMQPRSMAVMVARAFRLK